MAGGGREPTVRRSGLRRRAVHQLDATLPLPQRVGPATTVRLPGHEDEPPPLLPMPRWIHDAGEETTYELLRELSRGGEGRMFKARQLGAAGGERPVAVKVLTPEEHFGGHGDPAVVLRLWREQVQVMRNFAHEGFASVHVAFSLAELPATERDGPAPWWVGLPAFVMAWVDGTSLEAWRRATSCSARESLTVLAPCAEGLDAFHRVTGHVHRDLKPANIVVGTDGARVVDYGLLRSVAQLRSRSHLLGTAGYIAPELYRGAEYSPATDLYAFAGIALFALCGDHPVYGQRSSDVFSALKERGCPEAAPILAKAMARSPESRGPNDTRAAELLADLLAAVDHRPRRGRVAPPPPPPAPVARSRVGRAIEQAPPVVRALGVAFILCALTVIILLLTNY